MLSCVNPQAKGDEKMFENGLKLRYMIFNGVGGYRKFEIEAKTSHILYEPEFGATQPQVEYGNVVITPARKNSRVVIKEKWDVEQAGCNPADVGSSKRVYHFHNGKWELIK